MHSRSLFGIVAYAVVASLPLAGCPEPPRPLDLGDLRRLNVPPPSTASPTADAHAFVVLRPLDRTPRPAPRASSAIMAADVLTPIARELSALVRLPRDVAVSFRRCGEENAFYDPQAHTIVVCEELIALYGLLFDESQPDDQAFLEAVRGAMAFTFLHEVGHALIGELGIRNIGNPEGTADVIATVLLLQHGGAEIAIHGADAFGLLANLAARGGAPFKFWEEHGLDAQRFFEVACLIYGSDPETFGYLLTQGTLPWERARTCPQRWRDDAAALDAQLAPFRRTP